MKATIRYIEGNRNFTRLQLGTDLGCVTVEGESDFVLAMFFDVSHSKTLRESLRVAGFEDEGNETVTPLAEIERRYILSVLNQFGGNQLRAAKALRIDRSKLYRRLKSYRK